MNPVTHIIERQVLDLTLDTDREAQTRQEAARRVVQDRVLPLLDEVFTRLAGPDRVLRLDRLDIDLGTLSADVWEEHLVARVREQLEHKLQQHVHGSLYGEAAAASMTVAQSRLAAFMMFLDTGSLPWWVPDAASFNPGAELLDLIASQPEGVSIALRRNYRSERARRLVLQINPDVIEQLYTLLAPEAATRIKQVQRAWQRLGEAGLSATGEPLPSKTQVDMAVLDYLLTSSASAAITEKKLHEAIGRQMATYGGSIDRLMRAIALLPEADVAALEASDAGPLVAWLRKTISASSGPEVRREAPQPRDTTKKDENEAPLSAAKPETRKGKQKATGSEEARQPDALATDQESEHGATDARPRSPASEAETSKQDVAASSSVQQEAQSEAAIERILDQEPFESVEAPPLEGQAFYVTNAGLVLLWPFLGRFFKKMDLVTDKAFRTAALQQRAVLLTHYLVTGETEAPEQVLLLNKILCGWPSEATVPKAIDLTPAERDESQVLLEAAVAQWAALKNTSVAGLQQAFLQREGRLLKQPDAWTLKVDRTGYDVLLDRLPWSIAIIKHSWMAQPLFVEW